MEAVRKPRDPFDDEAKMAVDPFVALCERMDWLRDQQLMLSVGTQGVIHESQKLDKSVASLSASVASMRADMRWMRAGVFLMLAWEIAQSVWSSRPAQALVAMVVP